MASKLGQLRSKGSVAPDSRREPCLTCGEETAAGSVFFSDRLKVPLDDGTAAYLCSLCDERIRSSHRKRRMTDEEVAQFIRNGNAAGLTWAIRY